MTSLGLQYKALVCDLDGVVYRGPEAVPHAVDSIEWMRSQGGLVAYATNNASRPPAQVAEHLRELGLVVADVDVVNSSMAGAAYLAEQLDSGAKVLAVGGEGVALALADAGFEPVRPAEWAAQVVAVLQGYGPNVTADDLARTAYAVQGGATWVATNTDLTLPTALGTAPGNGSLVAAVRVAVDRDPLVVGKPGPFMYTMAAEALGVEPARTLGIGDRLETDVAGATAAGMNCLHVLTGVHGPADLIAAPADLRPRYVAEDLRALRQEYIEPVKTQHGWTIGECSATLTGAGSDLHLDYQGDPDQQQRLRLALAVLWEAIDQGRIDPHQGINCWGTGK